MKILIFTEGTILMHKNAKDLKRNKIVQQVKDKESSVHDYSSYVPISNAVKKLKIWAKQGFKIFYLTSRKKSNEINDIKKVLKKYSFPKGELLYRKAGENYVDVAKKVMPNILIEDNCESIGGKKEMTINHIDQKIKKRIKSLIVKEFGGIDRISSTIKK